MQAHRFFAASTLCPALFCSVHSRTEHSQHKVPAGLTVRYARRDSPGHRVTHRTGKKLLVVHKSAQVPEDFVGNTACSECPARKFLAIIRP
jgi:hypothetical protein